MSDTQQQRYDRIDTEYNVLFKNDKQLRHSSRAIRMYLSEPIPRFIEKDLHFREKSEPLAPVPVPVPTTIPGPSVGTNGNKDDSRGIDKDGVGDRNKATGKDAVKDEKRDSKRGWRRGQAHKMKRHILNVDNISRINYEMIKTTPGNVPANAVVVKLEDVCGKAGGPRSVKSKEDRMLSEINLRKRMKELTEIDSVKTKMFKRNLFTMNDAYIKRVAEIVREEKNGIANSTKAGANIGNGKSEGDCDIATSLNGVTGSKQGDASYNRIPITALVNSDSNSDTEEPPLDKQVEYLYEIQEKLIRQYKRLLRLQEKWFVLRELLLDANIELDLYSEEDFQSPFSKKRSKRKRKNSKGEEGKGNEEAELDLNNVKFTMVKLGSINIPTTHALSSMPPLVFNRTKRPDERDIISDEGKEGREDEEEEKHS